MFLTENDENTMSADTLGERLVLAREDQDLSTSQLARRIGVQTETLRNWETGPCATGRPVAGSRGRID
jgi:DNA-binding transcriptional regulator YiaG